ncbi:DUF2785 domain-containing protein [Streptococcus sp. NSJ-72]|uniref:DUF2785 domain-containing protein n=1 Tax=Streptococcus sp. NSJ-72 TaxID=2763068 RepID=UPI001650EBEC|nr:DUF2785 domain-containing protein [Streptococcus sp. NSJ-72]QNL43070.1 DUF2785 domain-containing protein [Streptococcus sp. NSJ-72]
MEKILKEKLAQDMPIYQQEEILWMLDHIGHPNYKIRDDLIFVSLARAIQEQLFTKDQFDFVVVEALKRQGLLYKKEEVGQATLIRSFTALLFANLLNADAKKNSLYFKRLSSHQRMALFEQGLSYLLYENDSTGYSEEYGWVHAFAHGADLLVEIIYHPDFPITRVIYQAVLNERLSQTRVAVWLTSLSFPLENSIDFIQFSNVRSCLLEIYLQLNKEKVLADELKETIHLFSY